MQDSFYNNPVYEHIVWSQMCVVESIMERYWIEREQDISIVSRDGKYGLVRIEHIRKNDCSQVYFLEYGLCDCHYDAIYNLKCEGWNGRIASGRFVVFSGGKCGLIEVKCSDDEMMFECKESVDCLFDSIEPQCNENIFVLYRGEKVHYYNLKTEFLSPEYDSIHISGFFLVCATKGETIIIDTNKDKRFVEEVR